MYDNASIWGMNSLWYQFTKLRSTCGEKAELKHGAGCYNGAWNWLWLLNILSFESRIVLVWVGLTLIQIGFIIELLCSSF